MKNALMFCLTLFFSNALLAQPPVQDNAATHARLGNLGRVYGKIIDAETKKPVEFASVVVFKTGAQQDSMVGGNLTVDNGDFNIEDLPLGGLKVKISFVGYQDYVKMVKLAVPNNVEMDLGDLLLKSDSKMLEGVVISAEKEQMQLSLTQVARYAPIS
jgi:hypothetical protein